MADDAQAELAQLLHLVVVQRLGRSHNDGLARVDAQGVEVLHAADGYAIVVAVAHHLKLNLLPALQALLYQDLRREGEGLLCQAVQLLLIVAEARTEAAQGEGCTNDDGIAQLLGSLASRLYVLAGLALDGVDVYLVEPLHKEFAVFRIDDGLDGSAQHLHSILLQYALLEERDAAVERRLSAKGEQDALRALLLDDALHEIGGYGQEIDVVGNALAGLDRGDVGVDEYGLDALFLEGFQGLRTAVVEFACLAYLQGSGAQQQDFLELIGWHSL